MNDNQIVDLYWIRSEKAIEETEQKSDGLVRLISERGVFQGLYAKQSTFIYLKSVPSL